MTTPTPNSIPSYRTYERRRLGGQRDGWSGIQYMVVNAFGAPTFQQFWQRWNPLFSYYLLYYCYGPLRRRGPRWLALVLTFASSGAVHDVGVGLLVGKWRPFFTGIFVGYALWVLAERGMGIYLSRPSWLRWAYHLAILCGTIGLGYLVLDRLG